TRPDFICELFLADGFEGGEICFPVLGIAVRPRLGRLVAWSGGAHHRSVVRPVVSGSRVSVRLGFHLKVGDRADTPEDASKGAGPAQGGQRPRPQSPPLQPGVTRRDAALVSR